MDRMRGKKEAAAGGAGRKLVALWHRGGRAVYRAPGPWPGAEPACCPSWERGFWGRSPGDRAGWPGRDSMGSTTGRLGDLAGEPTEALGRWGGSWVGETPRGLGRVGAVTGVEVRAHLWLGSWSLGPWQETVWMHWGATDGRSGHLHSSKRFLVKSLGEAWGAAFRAGSFFFFSDGRKLNASKNPLKK